MFAFSFLASLAVMGGLFVPWPVSTDYHLHIAKGGHWTLKVKGQCRLLFGEGGDEGKRQLKEILKEVREELKAEFDGDLEYHAKFTGEREIELFCSCESDDVCDLIKALRACVGEDRSTFSWDGNCLTVTGAPHRSEHTFISDFLSAILSQGSGEFVLTTDGNIAVAEVPGKLDENRQRLVLDPVELLKANANQRTLKIEGLAVEPAAN
ncbi:MAG TPA: hypothetical protein VG125_18710 [Pirellulales bacterium]|jgi:hypothetical protein|nr:hypothetical protein [Pirellulales bacterium]